MRESSGISRQDALKLVDKFNRITGAWAGFAEKRLDYSPSAEETRFHRLLERGHKEYRRRYAEQQKLLDNGVFIAKIASALAAMPAARHVRFHDDDDAFPIYSCKDKQSTFDAELLEEEELCKGLFKRQPMWYGISHQHALFTDASRVIPNFLAALDGTDVRLVSFELRISAIESFRTLHSSADNGPKSGSAMRDLRVFEFVHRGPDLDRTLQELEALRDFLAPMINAEKLEKLLVRLNLWNAESALDPAFMRSTSLIKPRAAWPNLSSVMLDTVHIAPSDLEHLLKSVRSPQCFVGLHKIHLTNRERSWASILDLLKERHAWANLTSPSGAECELMSLEEYEKVFGSYYGVENRTQEAVSLSGPTEAEAFIRGWAADNPLNPFAERDNSNLH